MVRFFYIYKNKPLLYLFKQIIRAALWVFCIEINTKNHAPLNKKGPLLIIANHPNSFLDAIIIGSKYNRRIHFLARGDVFKKKHHRWLLRLLNMIPVYRIREGKAFLHLNEHSFKEAIKILKNKEAVLIFIEGTCLNTHQLQPLKKGTARIIEGCHQNNFFPAIHLAGLAYNNFRGIGKVVNLSIEEVVSQKTVLNPQDRVDFNKVVFNALQKLIIPPTQQPKTNKTLFYYLHRYYYRKIEAAVSKTTKGTVFYDSVLFAALLFTYPCYLLLIYCALSFFGISQPIIFIILLCLPLFGRRALTLN